MSGLNMMRLSVALLFVLLGACSADPDTDQRGDDELPTDVHPSEEMSETILRMNNETSDFLLEGDIMIPKTRNALKCLNRKYSCLWPKRHGKVQVPYILDQRYDPSEKAEIVGAMKDLESRTCVRFSPRIKQTGYINIVPRFGCISMFGYLMDKQMLSLTRGGCVTKGIIQHELLHSLGFYHEHNRSDRDSYVTINWQNILKGFTINFKKQDTNNLGFPYDYGSVMHYGRKAFGFRGSETITPHPDSVSIGQRNGVSDMDIDKFNKLYKC